MKKTGFYLLPNLFVELVKAILKGLLIFVLWIIDLVSVILMLAFELIRAILLLISRFLAKVSNWLLRLSDWLEIQIGKTNRTR